MIRLEVLQMKTVLLINIYGSSIYIGHSVCSLMDHSYCSMRSQQREFVLYGSCPCPYYSVNGPPMWGVHIKT